MVGSDVPRERARQHPHGGRPRQLRLLGRHAGREATHVHARRGGDGVGREVATSDELDPRRLVVWQRRRARFVEDEGVDAFAAWDFSDRGEVVGSSGTQAFAWQAGIWRLLSPESNGSAFANNDVGQVAGYRFPGPEVVVWQDDTVTPAPIGPSFLVQPVEINDHGQVLIQTVSAELRSRALLWEPGGRVTDLGTLGGTSTKAVDVDDRGQILGGVGTTTSSGEIVGHTVLWTARPS